MEGHTGAVFSVSFSPDGTTLVSGSGDGTVKLWDLATRTEITTLEGHTSWVESVSFSPDGTTLVSGSEDETAMLWDTPDRPRPSGMVVISGDYQRGTPGAALAEPFVVEVRDQYDYPLPDAPVTFAITAGDGQLTIENTTTDADGRAGSTLILGSTPALYTVEAMVPGQEPVLFSAVGAEFSPYYIATLRGENTSWVKSVSFSPDGTTLASGSADGVVRLWDVATMENTATLEGHWDWISSVSFSPDGTTLAFGLRDGTVILWDVATRAEIATLEGHTGVGHFGGVFARWDHLRFRVVGIEPSSCGTQRPGRRSPPWKDIRTGWRRWCFRPTGPPLLLCLTQLEGSSCGT